MRLTLPTPPISRLLLGALFLTLLGSGCVPLSRQTPSEQGSTTTSAAAATTRKTTAKTEILSQKDFEGMGLPGIKPDQHEGTFRVQLNPKIPPYTFHVASETSSSTASIEIFRDASATHPLQTITLDPGSSSADMLPTFFNVQDVNFDGYADIGAPIAGGAKWIAYRYWTYNPKTGTFVETPETKELQKIGFNFINFDPLKKQITTDSLEMAGWRDLYQLQGNHIRHLKEEQLDDLIQPDANASTDHPTFHCSITTITYPNGKEQMTRVELPTECKRTLHTIPFEYPEAYKSLFQ